MAYKKGGKASSMPCKAGNAFYYWIMWTSEWFTEASENHLFLQDILRTTEASRMGYQPGATRRCLPPPLFWWVTQLEPMLEWFGAQKKWRWVQGPTLASGHNPPNRSQPTVWEALPKIIPAWWKATPHFTVRWSTESKPVGVFFKWFIRFSIPSVSRATGERLDVFLRPSQRKKNGLGFFYMAFP